jgi:hypothetical protein
MQLSPRPIIGSVRIQDLIVVHQTKDSADSAWPTSMIEMLHRRAFFLDTCLRQLAVFAGPADTPGRTDFTPTKALEFYSGANAYRFLLETATGLNSAIPAESNVFGQFRRAWAHCREHCAVFASRLAAPMNQLFADTRQIRAAFLQGVGGASYGSLVRKMLRPATDERVLFIGAGSLTRSMLPFFRTADVAVWNRSYPQEAIAAWAHQYRPEQAETAARWASQAILTTPANHANDQLWAGLLQRHGVDRVAHLGCRSSQLGSWADFDGVFSLDDVFQLRRTQSNVRSLQVQRARHACRELAARRAADHPRSNTKATKLKRAFG